jgi:small subunit ribosomal protein S3
MSKLIGYPIEMEVHVVDALSSAEAYVQAVLRLIEKKKTKTNWKKNFEELLKNRNGGVKPTAYRVWSSGRHNGAEIARSEKFQEGNLSFQRLKDPVDYAFGARLMKYGLISLKVWMLCAHLRPYIVFKCKSG